MAVTEAIAAAAPRRITILGSTGSVGCNTVNLLARQPHAYEIEALVAHRNVDALSQQARNLGAKIAVVADPQYYGRLKDALFGTSIEAAAGPSAVIEAASRPADWVMAAIVGAVGLESTIAAARQGAVIALANKESLVCGGALLMAEIARSGATLLPVDSEHNAIFQVFDFSQPERVERLILTASGGPFREADAQQMAGATVEQAIAHPVWDMGAKISVDSATMMNKGLELIEAHHLFGMPEDRIEVLVHPQSVVHSMVAYADGSVLAQLGTPDMRTPIAYTLAWPERMTAPTARLDLAALGTLTFEAPDVERFPALALARTALRAGAGAPTVLNAANEVAVSGFLEGAIGFLDIAHIAEDTLAKVEAVEMASLADVAEIDGSARRHAATIVNQMHKRRA